METIRVKLTFIDDVLGSQPADENIRSTYIASKAPDAKTFEEEVAQLGAIEVDEKGMTVFARDLDGSPCMIAYQIKGFFKAACGALRRIEGTRSSKLKAYKKIIDETVFVFPDADDPSSRMIPIDIIGEMGVCQRPLRAATAQGERVALSSSESISAGSSIEFDIVIYDPKLKDTVFEWLDHGRFNGLSQWRNSGKGAFTWEVVD